METDELGGVIIFIVGVLFIVGLIAVVVSTETQLENDCVNDCEKLGMEYGKYNPSHSFGSSMECWCHKPLGNSSEVVQAW